MRVTYACMLAVVFSGITYGTDWLGERGINVLGVAQDGGGAFIGQLELDRPGQTGLDPPETINIHVQPDAVFLIDQVTTTPLPSSADNSHSVEVAGLMIASDLNLPGVAPAANLSSVQVPFPTILLPEFFTLSLQNLSKQPSMSAINMSIGVGGAFNPPTGNSQLTLAFDWNATRWNILNIAAGNYGSRRDTSFQDNFNGMTIGYSEKIGDTWRRIGNSMYYGNDAAGGTRTSIDLIAPGHLLTLHSPGDPPNTTTGTGTSLAAPLVTGTAALLRAYASQKVGGGRW